MDHQDHLSLLRPGVPNVGGLWADLGAGSGAFTVALAELLGPAGSIYAVDRDGAALARQPPSRGATILPYRADFTRPLALPPLDGIVMANSLHFVRDKAPLVARLHRYLKPGGRLLLVEYNVDQGNRWVPFPLSFESWARLARRSGFEETTRLATRPSRFLGEIYSAASLVPNDGEGSG